MTLKCPNCNKTHILTITKESEPKSLSYGLGYYTSICVYCKSNISIITFSMGRNGLLSPSILTNDLNYIIDLFNDYFNYNYKNDYVFKKHQVPITILNGLPKQLLTTELELFLKMI